MIETKSKQVGVEKSKRSFQLMLLFPNSGSLVKK